MELLEVYQKLLEHFGPQGWWPMRSGFDPPEWEVCVGAILTQNTSWRNVEKALNNLKNEEILSPLDVIKIDKNRLENLIRPSGFYRQKAERLKIFADFVMGFGSFEKFSKRVTREQLLKVKGLGPETVDSILLYALSRPVFVVDAYTKRVFTRLGFEDRKTYEEWRRFFEENLPKDVGIYKESHALIVELGKNWCRKSPICKKCIFQVDCAHNKRR